jgi:hypothetical protein
VPKNQLKQALRRIEGGRTIGLALLGVKKDRLRQIVDIKGKIAGAAKLHEGLSYRQGCGSDRIRGPVCPETAKNHVFAAEIDIHDAG